MRLRRKLDTEKEKAKTSQLNIFKLKPGQGKVEKNKYMQKALVNYGEIPNGLIIYLESRKENREQNRKTFEETMLNFFK